jgi:hypothetical protein
LPLLCVISLNGGGTADTDYNKPGRDLGYTRYDKMARRWVAPPNVSNSPRRSGPPCPPSPNVGRRPTEGSLLLVLLRGDLPEVDTRLEWGRE